jgi:hypothetical protein
MKTQQGKSIGALYVFSQLSNRLGLTQILGEGREGKIALFLVLGRLLTQGSRLHLLDWEKNIESQKCLKLTTPPKKDELYKSLDWLSTNQEDIENKMFRSR